MTATTRIYIVKSRHESSTDPITRRRLVDSSHPAIALRHVAADQFTVEIASQADLVELITAGVKVETPNANQPE